MSCVHFALKSTLRSGKKNCNILFKNQCITKNQEAHRPPAKRVHEYLTGFMEPAECLKGGVVGCDGDGAVSLKIRLVMCRETVLCAGLCAGKSSGPRQGICGVIKLMCHLCAKICDVFFC